MALIVCLLVGCGTPPGPILQPGADARVWPPPPDDPRIRYLGEFRTDEDLKPGRGGLQRLGEALFGKDPPQQIEGPMAVCSDGQDRVFIADGTARVIHVLNLATRQYAQWRPPPDRPAFVQPIALAYDPAGRLLVSDSGTSGLVEFDSGGRYVGTIARGLLMRPCGVAVDAKRGRLVVADPGAHQVVVLDSGGKELTRVGRRGLGPGEFNFPTNVALDSTGCLYVSDSLNFRIQVFDPDFRFLRQIGKKGDMPGYFSQPKGLALDRENHLYVVDANFEAVQVFDSAGTLLMTFGSEGHGPGEFWLPVGVCVDAAGRLWVADSFNRRVQVFDYLPMGTEP